MPPVHDSAVAMRAPPASAARPTAPASATRASSTMLRALLPKGTIPVGIGGGETEMLVDGERRRVVGRDLQIGPVRAAATRLVEQRRHDRPRETASPPAGRRMHREQSRVL